LARVQFYYAAARKSNDLSRVAQNQVQNALAKSTGGGQGDRMFGQVGREPRNVAGKEKVRRLMKNAGVAAAGADTRPSRKERGGS